MLEVISERDWTELFLPQAKPNDVGLRTLDYTDRGEINGHKWEVEGGALGWGLTPGLSSKFTGVVGFFQTPRLLRGSNRDAGIESITPLHQLLPSVVQFGMSVWQMCLKNSPAAFRVDGYEIASKWDDYYGVLEDFAQSDGVDEWLASQIMNGATWIDAFDTSLVEGFDPDRLPAKYVHRPFLYSDLIRYVIYEVWAERIATFLETLTVAYVPPKAAAFATVGSILRDKHREMSQLLLEHPRPLQRRARPDPRPGLSIGDVLRNAHPAAEVHRDPAGPEDVPGAQVARLRPAG